jgi:hypothetical protein
MLTPARVSGARPTIRKRRHRSITRQEKPGGIEIVNDKDENEALVLSSSRSRPRTRKA